ncbi:hypothetical protein DFH08DRAFT_948344 [Mycena albidolilacea]|uniref:Uncharacterized protein n=1 Tax=Mycena albidolilacea TaxID=1033008 RepID=A0AAD7AQZ0_9AGAR|nr:hypothetical protein DFH08DRAFT_948344 [Mycena albidolilacea]
MDHYSAYFSSIQALFPNVNVLPTHHNSMHILDILKNWGPLASQNEFMGERANNTLQKVKTNDHFCSDILLAWGIYSSIPNTELRWGSSPRFPTLAIWEGMCGLAPLKGACLEAGAATPLVTEAAVGVWRPTRAAKGASTEEQAVAGVFAGTGPVVLDTLGWLGGLR